MFPLIRTGPSTIRSISTILRCSHSRQLSFLKNLQSIAPSSELIDKSNYQLIYEFPGIVPLSKFLRLKYTFPVSTIICVSGCYLIGVDNTVVACCLFICIAQFIITWAAGNYLKNTIGKVYINKGEDITEVLVSSLNESGSRVDRCFTPKELIPLSFHSSYEQALGFMKIAVPEKNIVYKLNLPSAKFHDVPVCVKLFGEVTKIAEAMQNKKSEKEKE